MNSLNTVQRLQTRGLKRNEALHGTPVLIWRNKQIPCMPSYEGRGTLIQADGNPVIVEFAAVCRRELFPTFDSTLFTWDSADVTWDDGTPLPKTGDILNYMGRQYKIVPTIDLSPDGSHVIFTFADPNSGL